MEAVELIFVPMVLFLIIVMPIWIVFHYITVWKRERHQQQADKNNYQDLHALAAKLEERLDAVESILDVDAPEWREHS